MQYAMKWISLCGLALVLLGIPIFADEGSLQDEVTRLEQQIQSLHKDITKLKAKLGHKKIKHQKSNRIVDFTGFHGKGIFQASAVTTSPTIGPESSFNGSDLQIAMSSMNEDVSILKRRQEYTKQRQLWHLPMTRPQIQLSGLGSVGFSVAGGDSDIDLYGFELDVFAEINSWFFAFATLNYDNGSTDDLIKTKNSRMYLGRAFITMGDLTKTPYYITAGQYNLPFGRYSTATITSPMTKKIGKILARGVVIGRYRKHNDSSTLFQGYFGQGPTSTTADVDQINYYGLNTVWKGKLASGLSVESGLGWTNNLFNAGAFVDLFATDYDNLNTIEAGIDAYARITKAPFQLNLEYVTVVDRITVEPGSAAALIDSKPRAIYTELRYDTLRHYPGVLAIGVAKAWDVGPLDLPQESLFLTDSLNVWKNTLQNVEFRYDKYEDGLINKAFNFRFSVFF